MTAPRRIELPGLGSIFHNRNGALHQSQSDEDVLTLHEKVKMIVDDDDAFQKFKEDLRNKKVITKMGMKTCLTTCVDSRIEKSNLSSSERIRQDRLGSVSSGNSESSTGMNLHRQNSNDDGDNIVLNRSERGRRSNYPRSSSTDDYLEGPERSRRSRNSRSSFISDFVAVAKPAFNKIQNGKAKVSQRVDYATRVKDDMMTNLRGARRPDVCVSDSETYSEGDNRCSVQKKPVYRRFTNILKPTDRKVERRTSGALRRSTYPRPEVYIPESETASGIDCKPFATNEKKRFSNLRATMYLKEKLSINRRGANDDIQESKPLEHGVVSLPCTPRRASFLKQETYTPVNRTMVISEGTEHCATSVFQKLHAATTMHKRDETKTHGKSC